MHFDKIRRFNLCHHYFDRLVVVNEITERREKRHGFLTTRDGVYSAGKRGTWGATIKGTLLSNDNKEHESYWIELVD